MQFPAAAIFASQTVGGNAKPMDYNPYVLNKP